MGAALDLGIPDTWQANDRATSGVTVNQPVLGIINSATDAISILELAITPLFGTSTAYDFGLSFGSSLGTYYVDGHAPVLEDPSEPQPPYLTIVRDWISAPSPPANFLRRVTIGAFSGPYASPLLWRFKRGLIIPPSNGLIVWALTVNASGAATSCMKDYYVRLDG